MTATPGERWSASSSECRRITRRPNKELKQTKPSQDGASQLNSVLDGPVGGVTERTSWPGVAAHQLPLPGLGSLHRLGVAA